MKMNFCVVLIFTCCHCFGQIELHPFIFSYPKELKFNGVEASKYEVTAERLKDLRIIDTLSHPDSYLINEISSVSIAIQVAGTTDKYNVYRLLTRDKDSVRLEEFADPTNRCASSLQITDVKSMRLDKSGNNELVLKFLHNSYCCETCAVPRNWQIYEGYVIFDFDKLRALEIVTRSNMQIVSNGVPAKEVEIKFEKNYLRFGKRKYYYKNDALVRK